MPACKAFPSEGVPLDYFVWSLICLCDDFLYCIIEYTLRVIYLIYI